MLNFLLGAARDGLRWLAIVSLIPITILAVVVGSDVVHFLSLSPLIRDIAHDLSPERLPKSKAFDARVKAMFPDGTKEDDLVRELKALGFETATLSAKTFEARSKCRYLWNVYWTRTPTGEVSNVGGKVTCRGNELTALTPTESRILFHPR